MKTPSFLAILTCLSVACSRETPSDSQPEVEAVTDLPMPTPVKEAAPPTTPDAAPTPNEAAPSAELAAPLKPIHESAGAGDLDAVKQHLTGGVDVNARDATGKTPLVWAVRSQKREVIYHLLDNGADPNIADNKGIAPLLWAVRTRRAEIVSALIDKGADVDAKDPKGLSALDLAAKFRADTVAELLKRHGAQ